MNRGARLLGWLLAAGVLGGCARPGFPPGGPIDTTPPRVAEVSPADSAVQVPTDAAIEVLFSESMDHATVRDGIRVFPPPGRPRFDWSGRRVRVTWDRQLAPKTTYNLLVSASVHDARGVPMGVPARVRFSTGDALDSGRVSGVLRTRTLRRQGIPILAFSDSLGSQPDTTGLPPSYATETDTAGVYSLTGLPVGRGFTIEAFYDLNANGSIEPSVDLVVRYPSPIRLTTGQPEADSINIVAVDPRAPGVLNGTIATHDSTGRFRVEAREVTDSSLVRRVERNGPGAFSLRVPAGTYRLRVIRVPAPETLEKELVVTREEPIEVKPEEQYGPFEFVFGEVRERLPTTPEPER